jgi:hypothetical protein
MHQMLERCKALILVSKGNQGNKKNLYHNLKFLNRSAVQCHIFLKPPLKYSEVNSFLDRHRCTYVCRYTNIGRGTLFVYVTMSWCLGTRVIVSASET